MIFQARLLPADEAQQLADAALALPDWRDGAQSAGKDIRARKHNRQCVEIPHDFALQLAKLMGAAPVVERLGPSVIGRPRLSRYGAGDHYGWHVDGDLGGAELRTDVSMSLVLQRADAGGFVRIAVGDVVVELDPEPGEAVFWASHLEHEIGPVSAGLRVVAIAGLQCQVADPVAREVLCRIGRLQHFHAQGAGRDDYAFALTNTLRLWRR